jgi:hypothetical protein
MLFYPLAKKKLTSIYSDKLSNLGTSQNSSEF